MSRSRGFLIVSAWTLVFSSAVRADDWPQWLGPKRDSVWRETGILETFPDAGPTEVWRAKVAGGYAGPAVANGRVYVAEFATDVDIRKAGAPGSRPEINGQDCDGCVTAV